MENIKEGCLFEIISHEIQDGIYENEVLLVLYLDSKLELSTGIEKQLLEVHFDKEGKSYYCSMMYDLDESGESCDGGRYYNLKDNEVSYIKEYIKQNNLPFIMEL